MKVRPFPEAGRTFRTKQIRVPRQPEDAILGSPKELMRRPPPERKPSGVAGKEISMTDVSSRNLQTRLLILVFLAFVPALGIFWYANRALTSLQLEAKEQDLVQKAEEVATDYRRLIDKGRAVLGALAEFDQIRTAPFGGCTEQLGRVLENLPEFTTISVIGLDGYLACGSLHPESRLFLGDRAYYIRVTSRNLFSVGEFALGRITGRPVVGLAQPLWDGAQTGPVLAASMDLGSLADRFRGGDLPAGFTFTVLDRSRRVLVRLPRVGDFTLADSIGAIAEESFPAIPDQASPMMVAGTDLDGIERLFAVAPLRGPSGNTDGFLAVGRTRRTLMEEVDEIVSLQLRFLAIGGIVLLAFAWGLGHFWLARCPPDEEDG